MEFRNSLEPCPAPTPSSLKNALFKFVSARNAYPENGEDDAGEKNRPRPRRSNSNSLLRGAPPLAPASRVPIFRAALVQTSAPIRPFHSALLHCKGRDTLQLAVADIPVDVFDDPLWLEHLAGTLV
jgi:hypothetical protein